MKYRFSSMLIAAALFAFQAGTAAQAANEENMLEACRARAAKALGIAADAVEVKYQGQRTDKTHAVNGSATVSGQSKTFQCSFERTGSRIVKFVVNSPESGARSSTDAHHEKAATAAGVPAAPEDGGPRNWEVVRRLSLREQPSTRAKIVASPMRPAPFLTTWAASAPKVGSGAMCRSWGVARAAMRR